MVLSPVVPVKHQVNKSHMILQQWRAQHTQAFHQSLTHSERQTSSRLFEALLLRDTACAVVKFSDVHTSHNHWYAARDDSIE